jgi:hypothetical protein
VVPDNMLLLDYLLTSALLRRATTRTGGLGGS